MARTNSRPRGKNAKTPPAGCGDDTRELLPARFSPSRLGEYVKCPAAFYFKTIVKLRSPATEATTKGSLAHAAFERIFDYPRGERTAEKILPVVREEWERLRGKPDYAHIAADPELVEKILVAAEDAVRAWFDVERANNFDPVGVELKLYNEVAGMTVLGIIDRMDRWEASDGSVHYAISDYKSGKVPNPDDRFLDEKFFAMKVYAVLVYETFGIIPDKLRLIYVIGGNRDSVRAIPCDMQLIERTKAKLRSLRLGIVDDARKGRWETRTQPLCNWCDYQPLCPAWHPDLAGAAPEDLREIHANNIAVPLPTRKAS